MTGTVQQCMLGEVDTVNWEAAQIRAMEDHTANRKVFEAIAIQESKCTSNLDVGLTLNPIRRPLLRMQPHKNSQASNPV